MANKHVTKHENGWQVSSPNSKRASRVTETKEQAINIAKTMAKNQKAELIIHGRDGKIQQKHSYGKDPYPPKG